MNKQLLGIALATITSATIMTGCTKTEQNAASGALLGALVGQATGGDSKATVIGAAIGAAVGSRAEDSNTQQLNANNGTTIRRTTVNETLNADGSVTRTGTTTTSSTQTTDGYTGLED